MESGAAEVEIEERGVRIVVRKQAATVTLQAPYASPEPIYVPPPREVMPSPPPVPTKTEPEEEKEIEGIQVCAPIVGTFYRRPSPDADPFVEVGTSVSKGDTLCLIEAMKNMNEVDSEVSGTVREILVKDGEGVSYDQPLFVIG